MKQLLYTLLITVLLSSCNETGYTKYADIQFNFGEGQYEEPFIGILKSKPEVLQKSLQFPPYSWLAPDTLILSKDFVFEFNEEAIRSKSTATISLVDGTYNPIKNLQFYVNDSLITDGTFTVKANSPSESFNIKCKVHPDFGDNTAEGYIMIQGNELDQVNSKPIQQEINGVGVWNLKQEYNIPWLLWLLWLLTASIIIALALVVIYYAVQGIGFIIKSITTSMARSKDMLRNEGKGKFKYNYEEENEKEENDDKDKLPRKIKKLIKIILNNTLPIHDRAVALNELQQEMDKIKKQNPIRNEKIWQLLPINIQNTLEQFYAAFKTPTNNGYWTGAKGDSLWIPDDNYAPRNREYSNLDSLSWREIKARYKFKGLPYKDGRAMFSVTDGKLRRDINCTKKLKFFVLNIPWEELIEPNGVRKLAATGNRKDLHNAAYKKFADINGILVEELNGENPPGIKQKCILTIHEEPNCQTLRLISQEIHGNLDHIGGVAVLKAIINNCG